MLSAGFLGGPGIGYTQDRQAAAQLQAENPQAYQAVKADEPNQFLFFKPVEGLNQAKVAVIADKGKTLAGGPGVRPESREGRPEPEQAPTVVPDG